MRNLGRHAGGSLAVLSSYLSACLRNRVDHHVGGRNILVYPIAGPRRGTGGQRILEQQLHGSLAVFVAGPAS